MSINIPAFFASTFATNVELLLQQRGSKLRGTVSEGTYVGSAAQVVDQIGAVEMQPVTSRFQPMGRVDAAMDSRWVYPLSFDLPQLIDSFDKLKIIVELESSYVQNAVLAAGRKIDATIIGAFLGTAKTGVNGGTSTSFTAGNEVDVAVGGANSRLNVAKLLAVKELARSKHIDLEMEPLYLALTAKDESSLFNEIQIISSDFNGNDKPVMQDGRLNRFLGINFVYSELIETLNAGTNEVNVPVWVKSGMHLGMWEDVKASVSVRNDIQSEPFQVYLKLTLGATRIEENKIFNIESYRA